MNLSEAGRSGIPERARTVVADLSAESLAELDAIAVVAAHGALNSLAFIVATLTALQEGGGIDPEDEPLLLSRAIVHTGRINAVLHDLILGLPIGLSPVVEDRSPVVEDRSGRAEDRFGFGRGTGLDSSVEVRPTGAPPPWAVSPD